MGNSKSVLKNHEHEQIDKIFSQLQNRQHRLKDSAVLEKEAQIVLSGADLLFFKRIRPDDREISIFLSFDEHGILSGIFPNGQTSPCVPPNCKIQAANSVLGIHTHPIGERVSSADLIAAIRLHPETNKKNKRRLSMVIAPNGVYIYKPTHHIIRLYKGQEEVLLEKFKLYVKWVGHQLQEDTQRGHVHEFLDFVRGVGFDISYIPYDSVVPTNFYIFKV